MIAISCTKLNKYFSATPVLENINFAINQGEKVGLIGINGAGKSTLFKILTGELSLDQGEVFISKHLKVGYLLQNTHIESDLRIYDYALGYFDDFLNQEKALRDLELEISKNAQNEALLKDLMALYAERSEAFHKNAEFGYESRIKGIYKGLGFSEEELQKPINHLSGGQKSRVLLGYLLLQNPDILLLDEPTNHLDLKISAWLERYLREYAGTVFIISHDRYFLDQTVQKIFHLNRQKMKIYHGNYSEFLRLKKSEDEMLQKQYTHQQQEIKRLEEMVQRLGQYGSRRNITQSKSKAKMLDRIEKIDAPEGENTKAAIQFLPKRKSGNDVLEVSNLAKSFDAHPIFENLNFKVYGQDKIGIIGENGIGKSTLFNILAQQMPASQGSVKLGHHVDLAYYEQEQKNLSGNKAVVDEIWDEHPLFDQFQIRSLLARFLFIGDDIFKEISSLSGGEKARLSLLKLMLSEANFLLMDEPTNHLDMDAKTVLEDALIAYTGTLLIISHDRYFLNRVCHKIFEFTPTGIEEYLGNYDYYLEKKSTSIYAVQDTVAEKTKTQINLERKKEREKNTALKKQKSAYAALEKKLHDLDAEMEKIDHLLCQEEIYTDIQKSLSLQQQKEALERESALLLEELVALDEEICDFEMP